MQVQVHYQGMEHSPWMEQFIARKVDKLSRYLSPAARIQVHLKIDHKIYVTSLSIHSMNRDYAFTTEGENLWESFSLAIDHASRSLGEHKRRVRDRIAQRSSLLRSTA